MSCSIIGVFASVYILIVLFCVVCVCFCFCACFCACFCFCVCFCACFCAWFDWGFALTIAIAFRLILRFGSLLCFVRSRRGKIAHSDHSISSHERLDSLQTPISTRRTEAAVLINANAKLNPLPQRNRKHELHFRVQIFIFVIGFPANETSRNPICNKIIYC